MTAELLARWQFAFTVSFHIIFPAFSIGLASYLAVLNALWLGTKDETYLTLFNHWKKIFAVAFGMGVVSGIVMSYQFGTNWSVFSDKAGPVIGPLMGYEVLTAFFLEAGFLGIMLFGRKRVGDGLHMVATAMVAIGTLISATWILSVNSWMQTPAGFSIAPNGQFIPEDWWAIVFNPSFPYRLVHMVLAAYLTTALVVGAASAWHLLKDRRAFRENPATRRAFAMAMGMLIVVAPLQIIAGDEHGLNTLEHQPAKIAAMEGHFTAHAPGEGVPLLLFGIPDQANQKMDYAIGIPHLGSLILTHSWDGQIPALSDFPIADQPPVWIVFWSFRVMVALGFAMLGLGIWALFARLRGALFDAPWLHRAAVMMGPAGFIAVLAGWITTEVGRQPWTVYGHLRTAESHSPLEFSAVATSLTAFVLVYFFVFGAGTFYLMRMMSKSPGTPRLGLRDGPIRTAGIAPGVAEDPMKRED
ncbi:cytochrome D ubiquinol oxidase subunit I [Thioclava sp. SK-1]|uniref:cytochrome ubiquinol oxidase subunit I n=1 Tax=Thioclava sp. SK-1 TaxID=1889770 RepID=UPI0008264BD8|nr:cytochrome ubiquinol oxidase subunit I [Thioclava sp. SK-1]OCX62247.1 cytochrome D ubiquinol oxidase subunit I [Thioclava sp. SK-1]